MNELGGKEGKTGIREGKEKVTKEGEEKGEN